MCRRWTGEGLGARAKRGANTGLRLGAGTLFDRFFTCTSSILFVWS